MGANTHIQWATHTFNCWEGCTKVSAGCKFCYAETRNARFGGGEAPNWGKGAPRRRTSKTNWRLPLKWNREAEKSGTRPRVFCASLADVFDAEVQHQWRADLFRLIQETPNLDWLLLTKRPQNVMPFVEAALMEAASLSVDADNMMNDWVEGKPPANVWLGTSVEDSRVLNRVVDLLTVPARVHFLSNEPLLGDLNLRKIPVGAYELDALKGQLRGTITRDIKFCSKIDWVICGGESGTNARIFEIEWARDLLRQCRTANVPFFMKQLGQCPVGVDEKGEWHGAPYFLYDGHDKGGNFETWPMCIGDLKVREMPEVV